MEDESAIWSDKRFTQCHKLFNRVIIYFLGVPLVTPIAGMQGDIGWIPPKVSHMMKNLRFWNRVVSMHPDRLTRNILKGIGQWTFVIDLNY